MPRKSLTTEQIAEALVAHEGVYAAAARALGCRPETVSRRVKGSPRLKALAAEIEEAKLDRAEGKLLEAVDKGTLGAITFYLRAKGRKRGYGAAAAGGEDGDAPQTGGAMELPEPATDAEDWATRFKPKR